MRLIPSSTLTPHEDVAQVLHGMSFTRTGVHPRHSVLLTAPHGANLSNPDHDDPCTSELTHALAHKLTRARIQVHAVVAVKDRREQDQNRLAGLIAAGDMWHPLHAYRMRVPTRRLCNVVHLDIHSFDPDRLPTSERDTALWGKGINLICLHDDKRQLEFAEWMKQQLDRHLAGKEHDAATILPMKRIPKTLADGASNAMCEWARHHGALSLLAEVPVTVKSDCAALAEKYACVFRTILSGLLHTPQTSLAWVTLPRSSLVTVR